jgi:hypothetical protein
MKAGFMTDSHAGRGEGVRPEMVNLFRELIGAINRTGMRELSSKLDVKRVKDHWSTVLEKAARSFESYIIAKLQDQNKSNDYLANVVNDTLYAMQGAYKYPSMDEMPAIREAFDNFSQTGPDPRGRVWHQWHFSAPSAPRTQPMPSFRLMRSKRPSSLRSGV